MKHLHYAGQVLAISDGLASMITEAVSDFLFAGKSAVWPVAGYQDEREVVAQMQFGPGIPWLIVDSWLPDERVPARHDDDSIAYIEGEKYSLDSDLPED
ncbi:hypothetical protein ACL9RL_09235 [Plantibacter sp. Mn2098]|uniref:hypothetical protein n=1 Tax=Plantibacter sp. Mn2098 TaxID=3395266 RepID=UPI003BD679A1